MSLYAGFQGETTKGVDNSENCINKRSEGLFPFIPCSSSVSDNNFILENNSEYSKVCK